jgi:hypothetical protein
VINQDTPSTTLDDFSLSTPRRLLPATSFERVTTLAMRIGIELTDRSGI